VRQIIIEKIASNEKISDEDAKKLLKLELPRASSYDEKIHKYSCEAKLISGDHYQVPITYESQLDDSQQHVVSVDGIAMGDLIGLQAGLAVGIKKLRGEANSTLKQNPAAMMGDRTDDDPNAKPNTEGDAKNKASNKEWQDENGFIHYPDGSISDGPVD